MNKYSIRSIPAAAAMVAALAFGVAHAQPVANPPGSTNPRDASQAPGTANPARTGDAMSPNGNPVSNSKTMTPGTSKSKDNVAAEPAGGMAKSPEQRDAAKMAKADKKAAKRGARKAKMASKGNPPVDGVDTTKGGTK